MKKLPTMRSKASCVDVVRALITLAILRVYRYDILGVVISNKAFPTKRNTHNG